MKSKRLTKLLAVIASVLLAVTVTVCITAFAGESDPATIKRVNISYDGAVRIVYDVALNDAEAQPVLLVWDGVEGEKTAANATYVVEDYGVYQYADDYEGAKFDGVYFMSRGFAPKDMRKPISAAVAVSDGNDGYIYNDKEVATLSIFDYVMKRFENDSATPDQKALYTSLLNYGGAVQAVIYESSIKDNLSVEEATAKAGLEYGYVDAYVGVRYYESAMIKGVETKSEVITSYHRAGVNVELEAPVTYMGRFFAGFVDADGEAIADAAPSRYLNIDRNEPGMIDVVASYERITGVTASFASDVDEMTLSIDQNSTVSLTELADGGVSFKKPTKYKDGETKTSNPSVSIKPSTSYNKTGDNVYVVADMDISFIDIPVDCMTDSFAFIVVDAGDMSYRLNVARNANNVISFQTSMENRYTPTIVISGFDDDNGGVVNDSDKVLKRIDASHGTRYWNVSQPHNDGFSGFRIDAEDLKNIRIEIHPEKAKPIDYNYIVMLDADGNANTTDDQTRYNRTTQVLAPEVRLYVNGEYCGSTYHGGPGTGNWNANVTLDSDFKFKICSDAANDVFSTPANEILKNKTVPTLNNFKIAYMGNGIGDIRLANMHYALYSVENPYYVSTADSNVVGNYDYTKTGHISSGRLTTTPITTPVCKAADNTYSIYESEGATKYQITWQNQGWGTTTDDGNGFYMSKIVKLISVTDADGNDLLADGATFEGVAAGDIIPKAWLNLKAVNNDKANETFWGQGITVKNYPTYAFGAPEYTNADTFVYETDLLFESADVADNHTEPFFADAAGTTIIKYLIDIKSNGNIQLREREHKFGATSNLDKAVIGKVGEKINLRFEFVINDYKDMTQNRIYVYSNNALVLTCDSFSASSISIHGINQFAWNFPSTARNATITLTNSFAVRYVKAPTAALETENDYVFDWDSDKTVGDYADVSANSNVNVDKTPETATKGYLYIDNVNGEDVLRYGTVAKNGEKHVYLELPENELYYDRITFSTEFWISSGLSANKDDFLRFVLADKKGGKKGEGGINQIVFNPVAATTGEKVDYVLSGTNLNTDYAVIEQDQWNSITIEYDVGTKQTNVYVNGVMVMRYSDRQSGFTSTDVNFIAIEMRGSFGNLKNIDVMFKDIEFGYTMETITAEKVVDYTNAADLYSVHYDNIINTKFANAGGSYLVGTLDGKNNAYTMSWKYAKESFADLDKDAFNNKLEASTLLFYFNNGNETTGKPTSTAYSAASNTTRYVFETDIRYNKWVFNDLTKGTSGVKTADDSSKYYDSWLTYFNICDTRDGGDVNSIGTVQTEYNSKTKTLKLGETQIQFDKWYHLRIEITCSDIKNETTGNRTISYTCYLDDVVIKTGTNNTFAYKSGTTTVARDVNDAILGFRIKNKSMAYFSEGGMSLANTSFAEYEIAD